VDSKSAFVKRFGDLIALLRADPGNDAAQDLALTAAAAAVETEPLEVEAGVQWSVIPDELTLKGRLLARQVELIRVAAGAEPHQLLALARALSHDSVPVVSSPQIQVEMVEVRSPPPSSPSPSDRGAVSLPSPAPTRRAIERRGWEERRRPGRAHWVGIDRRRRPDRRVTGERRLQLISGQRAKVARLHDALRLAPAQVDAHIPVHIAEGSKSLSLFPVDAARTPEIREPILHSQWQPSFHHGSPCERNEGAQTIGKPSPDRWLAIGTRSGENACQHLAHYIAS